MPIEQTFETKEAAPEFLRDHLTEADGKFVFKAELPNEVTGLKSALESERKLKTAAEKALKGYDGIDPAKAREVLSQQQKAEEDAAKAKGDWDNWKAQMQKQHEAEKQALEQKLKQTESEFEAEFVDGRVNTELLSQKGRAKFLKPFVGARSVVEDGKRVIRIFDEAGSVRYGKDGKPLTITERVLEMTKDPEFTFAFEGTGAGGSGTPNGTGGSGGRGGKTLARADFEKLSPSDQMAFMKGGGGLI